MNSLRRIITCFGSLSLFIGTGVLQAQQAFCVMDSGGRMQLVKRVSSNHLFYGVEGSHSVRMERSGTAILNYPRYIPGLINVERRNLTHQQTSVIGSKMHDTAEVYVSVLIRPDRDFDDLYMVVSWYRSDRDPFYLACPIGPVKSGLAKELNYSLHVPVSFGRSHYRLMFFSEGIEVENSLSGTSERSPFQAYLRLVGADLLVDGPPKPLIAVAPVSDWDDKDPEPQRVVLKVRVDANGYAIGAEVEQTASLIHNTNALEAIRFWEFKPAIENGVPVSSTLRIPMVF